MSRIFNDYNADGYRRNINGNRSHYAEDEAIVRNLRYRFPNLLSNRSDQFIVNAYDEFAASDMFGDNDERFPAFLSDYYPEAK